ncbi:MAG: LptF/LptG family permease [Sediminibacterium sp.]|nr:LptF/LptG family permease [Sediminibacterium sp.]
MKILDWYIIKKFIFSLFFTLLFFTMISVVIDISEKTEDFVRSQLSPWQIFLQYYIGFIPFILATLMPIITLITVIFFTSKMAGNSEIVAIISSGVKYNRWLRPYLITGIFLSFILWILINYIVPKTNIIKNRFEAKYIDANSTYSKLLRTNNNIYFRLDSTTYCGIINYNDERMESGGFYIYKFKDKKLDYNLRSHGLLYDTAKKGWKLMNVYERWVKSNGEKVEMKDFEYRDLIFKPADLTRDKYTKDKLNLPELRHLLYLEELRGSERIKELRIELYRRQSTPIMLILLVLVGAITAGKKVRGGSGVHIAIGIILSSFFVLLDRFSTIFSTKGNLPPLIATTVPLLIFAIVVSYFYNKAPK